MRIFFALWIVLLYLATVITISPVHAQTQNDADKIVAKVNDVPIFMVDVKYHLDLQAKEILEAETLGADATQKTSLKIILENLIEQELLVQEARKKGIAISPARVKAKIVTLQKELGGIQNLNQARAIYFLEGERLFTYIEKGLMIARLLEKEAYPMAWAAKSNLRNYYKNHLHQFTLPEMVRARHILIKSSPDSDQILKSRAFETILSIEKKLIQGDNFAALAIEYSQCPSSILGGDLGYFSRDDIIPEISAMAFTLDPGQISPAFETRLGYHLIQCVEKIPPQQVAFQKVKKDLEKMLRYERETKLSADYVARLKKKAQIKRLVP